MRPLPTPAATGGEHGSISEDAPRFAGAGDQPPKVATLVNRLRSDHPLDPDEIAFEAVHDALLAQRVAFDLPGPPTGWHVIATVVDIVGFEIVEWGSATNIPGRAGDQRRLATIGAVMAIHARVRGQIARTIPLTAPAATYWAIDDDVTIRAHAEICVDADSGRVKGAAVTLDPASLDLTGTAIHALTQRHPTHRHDFPSPQPSSGGQGRRLTNWSTPDTNRSAP